MQAQSTSSMKKRQHVRPVLQVARHSSQNRPRTLDRSPTAGGETELHRNQNTWQIPNEKLLAHSTAPTNDPTSTILSPEQKLVTEPFGTTVDLLKMVALPRNGFAGEWRHSNTALIDQPGGRIDRPEELPENNPMEFSIRRIETTDTPGIGFVISGHLGVVAHSIRAITFQRLSSFSHVSVTSSDVSGSHRVRPFTR
jgi:hypothetical protein